MIAIRPLRLFVLLMLLVIGIAGCETGTDQMPIPTRGPAIGSEGGSREAFIQVSASTNCAEPGDTVDFTLKVKSESTSPITLTGHPLLEMTIQSPYYPKLPTQYWSQSNSYPAVIDPLLKPFEERIYHWKWKADPIYAPNQLIKNGIILRAKATAYTYGFSNPVSMESHIGVGVKALVSGGSVGEVSLLCRNMR